MEEEKSKSKSKSAYDVLSDTRGAIEEILARLLFIKKEGRNRAELRELFTQASVAFLSLRQINRIILQDEDRIKQETEAAKLPVDYTTLQLNNLLYQKNYYIKAINACKDFKSRYPDIELVPEEDFFRDVPLDSMKDPDPREDAHKTMLKRLNYELHQRKELCKQRELLEARKKMLQESIVNRKKFLSSLPSHLKALKKASLPVQQQLGILYTKRMKQHSLAELLPTPLYILYTQVLAYKEAFDDNIELEIIGSAKDGQAIARQQALKDSGFSHGIHEEMKLEEDIQEEEDDSQRRRKRTKKSHIKEILDEGVYHAHPLSVLWHIYDDDFAGNGKWNKLITLRFEYLMKLKLVCAGVEGSQDGPLVLLTNLFPDDSGEELPTEVAKLSAGVDFQYDTTRRFHPYKWVQHLAGVDFLSEQPPLIDGTPTGEYSKGLLIHNGLIAYRRQHRVQTILEKLRRRKKSHLALKEQLDTLACIKLPDCLYTEIPWGSCKCKCYLQSWAEITPAKVQKAPVSNDDTSIVLSFTSPPDEMEVSPINSLESVREDGELPAAGLVQASKGSKYADLQGRKRIPVKEKNQIRRFPAATLKGAFTIGNSGSTSFQGLETVGLDDEIMLSEAAILAEGSMEDVGVTEALSPVKLPKVKPLWEDCGTRVFTAVFRRDDGPGGKPIELEAKVKLSSEYPTRPPQFKLCSVSEGLVPSLPKPPAGVLDVIEKSKISVERFFSFSELHAMEIQVNMRVLEFLPESRENETLAQQLSFLAMVFDTYIDHKVSPQDNTVSSLLGLELSNRSIRGRDREMQIL